MPALREGMTSVWLCPPAGVPPVTVVRSPDGAELRLTELVASISLAGDLVTGQPVEHALQTCRLSVLAANQLALEPGRLRPCSRWLEATSHDGPAGPPAVAGATAARLAGSPPVGSEHAPVYGDGAAPRHESSNSSLMPGANWISCPAPGISTRAAPIRSARSSQMASKAVL